jgi:transposase-like protein
MDDAQRLARYTCEFCKKRFVVPDLARLCEDKHMMEEI